jgi:hypothetical protein
MTYNPLAGKIAFTTIGAGATHTISNVALASYTATVTLNSVSGLSVGQAVLISGLTNAQFNGLWYITAIIGSTIQYQLIAPNFSSTSDSGLASYGNLYAFRRWRLPMDIDLPDVTNFTSAGAYTFIPDCYRGIIELEGAYDAGNMPLTLGGLYSFTLGFQPTVPIALVVPAFVKHVEADIDVKREDILKVTAWSSGPFAAIVI